MRRSEVLAEEAVSVLSAALARLRSIWEEIGIPENQRLQRTNTAKEHIKELLQRMVLEEEKMKSRILSSIQNCRAQREQLYMELQFPPFQEEEGISILQQEKNIRTQVEFLTNERSWRRGQLQLLLEEDQELSDALCCPRYDITAEATPTPSQLQELQQHVSRQREEKERRGAEFLRLKERILLSLEDLDQLPETSLQRELLSEDQEAFCLSTHNLNTLRTQLHQLEERVEEVKEECVSVRDAVQSLWERLKVSEEERESLRPQLEGNKKRNLEALSAELSRLEVMKMLNLRHMIQDVRRQISVMWEKCFLNPEEQQQSFSQYRTEELSEELLSLHDAELQRLQKHFEEHQQLFEGVQRWRDSWRQLLELEVKAADPNRFTNRGGNLLRDEKQRTELQKSLTKLESRLRVQVEEWEGREGRDFLLQGQSFLQYVEQQRQQQQNRKQQQRQDRKLKKTLQTEEDMMYGTVVPSPTKRRFLLSTTPNRSRKLNSSSSLRSVHGGPVCRSPGPRPLTPSNKSASRTPLGGKPPQPRRKAGNQENMENPGKQVLKGVAVAAPAGPQRNCSLASVASTYSQFLRELVNTESVHTSESSQKPSTPPVTT